MANNKQCAYWFLTINENAKCYEDFENLINKVSEDEPNLEYAYIKHNADEEDANLHYHLTLYFKGKVKRFTTIQNMFEGAHIEQTNQQRYKRCIQYLIHKNNPEKQQYKITDIISNIMTVDLNEILIGEGYDFELFREEKIFEYFDDYGLDLSMSDLVKRFGLGGIKGYYFILKDMIKDYKELTAKTLMRYSRLSHENPTELAWRIYSHNLKREYQIFRLNYHTSIEFEEFERQEYLAFIDNIEKGYIKVDEIIQKGVEN